MSNKNIALPRYKWQPMEPLKPTIPSPIHKQERKIHIQYSPKNMPSQIPKYFKPIYRHASEQQFRRYIQPSQHNGESVIVSAEQEYHSHYVKGAYDMGRMAQTQVIQPEIPTYASRNPMKDTSSTASIEHSATRRVSPPGVTPAFFRSKQHKNTHKQNVLQSKLNIDCFKKLHKLGEGKFGTVFLVREIHTGFTMALKVLQKKKIIQQNLLQQFIRQLKIQAFLNHPNIIDVYGFFHDQHHFYSLLELGCDGQLYNIISQHKFITEQATSFITKNLLEAVNCMHKNQILHRDIKPENIVLIMGNVKLCDFGWAVNKITKQQLRSTFCGTPLYLSPELLKGQRYDEKVDLWAIGILAYELLVGCSPFQINQQQDLLKILTEQVKFPKNKKISPQFQQFIQHILNKNPKERLASSELLKLPFIRKYQQFETCEQLCG